MRRTDGQVRWHRIAARPRRLPDGSTLWDGLQTDITEARLTADELEEQRRRAQMAVEATGLGLWEWDLRSNALAWSERNRALFGVAADEEVTIERYMALVHPEDVAEVRNAYASAREAPGGGDYAVEHRVVTPAGELRWVLAHGRVATDQEGPRLVIGTTLDITERRAADEQRNLLMRELAHRSKNGIAVIMAIVSQTARGMESAQAFEQLLMSRLQAMAQSQDLVTVSGGQPVPLIDVATKTLTPFGLARFDVDAALQAISVPGDVAVGLGLLLHEMATNAVKYGALSVRKGRVGLSREAAVDGLAAFAWRESGGPEVKPGGREGFGTRLLEAALRNQGGKVVFAFEPPGFRACVEFPTES
jgi:PAS domain S-box-containing protein